jgi:hypothetical protein
MVLNIYFPLFCCNIDRHPHIVQVRHNPDLALLDQRLDPIP